MVLPANIRKYFWDIDTKKAQPRKHPQYYIDRLLELGDNKAVNWLKKIFGIGTIRKSLNRARISRKSLSYWKLIFS